MKRIILLSLLTLALLAPGISKAQYTIPNGSFENWTSTTAPDNWVLRTGKAMKLNGVQYTLTINGNSQTVFRPAKDGQFCVSLQNAQVGSTLVRGIMQDSFPFTGKPANFAMNYSYFAGSTEQFAIVIQMTKWNTTTKKRDTVLNAQIVSSAGFVEPWKTMILSPNISGLYKGTSNPDTCRILVINTIAASSTVNTTLIIDQMWFQDAAVTGIEPTGIIENGSVNAYPNPFSGITNIHYNLTESGMVNLKIFDISGKEVATLVNENQIQGIHEATFNAEGLKAGMYFYTLQSGNSVEKGKLILNK